MPPAQVVGNRFSSVFGFDSAEDAERAVPLIRNAARRRPVARAAHSKRLPVARA
ncbi:MAG TPA: hypothetical protein VNA04_03770 [Thermoanaerobaculia bacterium]|nr:hypothetical protein [Thermoanaerobaculia bacterium]